MSAFEAAVSRIRGEGLFFSLEAPVYISRAPGRLDLMGGNVDYTGGLVFQSTIREATWAAAQRRSDGQIVFLNPQMKEEGWLERVEFDLQDALTERTGGTRSGQCQPRRSLDGLCIGCLLALAQSLSGSGQVRSLRLH